MVKEIQMLIEKNAMVLSEIEEKAPSILHVFGPEQKPLCDH